MKQYITRKGEFDAAHRILHERIKCFNLHGHRFGYELKFSFEEEGGLGYAIDFKEIKRVACQFIDDYFDHGFIANPMDDVCINACGQLNSKLWIMSLNGGEYCNPSAEHISKELFLAISRLMDTSNLKLESLRLYETPNCWVDADDNCISATERDNFWNQKNIEVVDSYKKEKGVFEYDARNVK